LNAILTLLRIKKKLQKEKLVTPIVNCLEKYFQMMSYWSLINTAEMDYCHTQSSEKFTQERVIVVLPIKLVLITFNDFFSKFYFF
jgi:hypothetical protein